MFINTLRWLDYSFAFPNFARLSSIAVTRGTSFSPIVIVGNPLIIGLKRSSNDPGAAS
jgi:hypothetical protein